MNKKRQLILAQEMIYKKKKLIQASFIFFFFLVTVGCSKTERSTNGEESTNSEQSTNTEKPNILYILTDQWKAQATGYSGDPNLQGKTPNLDGIAETGINYVNAVSVIPVCTPYRAALLTGQFPTTTGMFLNDLQLDADALTMAEIFAESGYKTGFIGKWHLDGMGRSEFTPPERRQGFEYWKALEVSHDYNDLFYYTGTEDEKHYWEGYGPYAETDDAIEYIKQNAAGEDPFLLFLSFGTPHFPHDNAPEDLKQIFLDMEIELPPNIPDSRKDAAKKELVGYYAHIVALDSCIGKIRNALIENGIEENTVLVFTSDHGEMMGAHDIRPKLKQLPYAESAKVPFLLRYPARFGDKKIVVEAPINTPDILPTLLTLAEIPVPQTIEGESMVGAINNPEEYSDKAALIMNISPFDVKENDEYRGIYTSRYAYIENLEGPWLLFDNVKDPYQMNNLVDNPQYDTLQTRMDSILSQKLSEIGDEFKPRDYYLEKWGYELNNGGYIDYGPGSVPQGPAINKK